MESSLKMYDRFDDLRDTLGDEAIFLELLCWFSTDELKEFVEHCERFYDCKVSD